MAVLVLAIMGAFLLPRFFSSSETGRYVAHQEQRRQINEQVQRFYFDYGYYPTGMTKADWTGPDAVSYKNYFEGSFPHKCSFDIPWTLRGGRVDMVGHVGHEEDAPPDPDEHQRARIFINKRISQYYDKFGVYPESMTNAGWIGPDGETFRLFFPEGVPETCPNGLPWHIDSELGRLSEESHQGHED